jgi:hypothetical protein
MGLQITEIFQVDGVEFLGNFQLAGFALLFRLLDRCIATDTSRDGLVGTLLVCWASGVGEQTED